MDRRMCVLIMLFAAAIALPQCATRPRVETPRAEPARVEPANTEIAAPKADPSKAVAVEENVVSPSTPVGSIHRVNRGNREVLVRTKRILHMGERVYAEVGDEKAMMTATFPMLTSSKCTLEAASRKYFGKLAKGMPVYLYVPGEKKAARTEPTFVDTHKAGETKTVGGMELVYVPSGSFMMGSKESPEELVRKYGGGISDYRREQPRHRVSVDGFWMGKYEVTQAQYKKIMGKNPSHFKGWFKGNRPVEQVSWHNAQGFCWKFSEKHKVAVRLPTEAEWEYACRAGSETAYFWGDNVRDACRYGNLLDRAYRAYRSWMSSDCSIVDCNDGYAHTTAPVGRFRPNAFGLYDIIGNVNEWCADWYDEQYYANSPERNPKGPERGTSRVLRGGSWYQGYYLNLRSAFRDWNNPDFAFGWSGNGFRVVVSAGGK